MRKSGLLVAALLGVLGGTASAADLARKAPAYIPQPVPTYFWTGCYIGGNVGGAWSHIEVTDVPSGVTVHDNNAGFAGGGQIGCDYQMNSFVFGIRNMFDGTSISKSVSLSTPTFTGTADSRVNWFDTLTGRVGYLLQPDLLIYGQGGAAWTQADLKFSTAGTQIGELSRNKTGWTAGGGVEWMFMPHWSAFVEYNFMGFGTRSSSFAGCGGTCILSGKADIQDVLVGVNYKF